MKMFCHYYNNDKECPYDDQCIFAHEESPDCKFGKGCERIKCMFQHEESDESEDEDENESDDDDGSEGDENIFAAEGHVFDKDDPANYSESDVDERGSDESEGETDSGDEEIFVSSLKEALKMSGDVPSNEEQEPATEKPGKINKKSGEMLVKVLDLKNVEEQDASEDESSTLVETDNSKKKISSFFVGGESESEEEADGEYDEESLAYGEDVLQMRQESLKNKFHKEGRAGVGLNGRGGFVRGRGRDNEGGRGRGRGSDDRGRGRGRGNDRGRGNGKFDNSRGRGRGDFDRGRGRGDFQMRGRGRGDFNRGGRGTSFNESRGGNFTSSSINNSVPMKSTEVDANVHPSWAAKKRQNTTIAKFEGKKIKFGDDGGSINSSKPAYVPPVVKAPPSAAPTEKLHPSWAAKQNQKSSIQAFQGKKVVFGD